MTRRLAGTVIINGTDDEGWPDTDEHVHRVVVVHMLLDVGQPASAIQLPDVRWGGECRVELELTARAIGKGVVQIEGNAKLFEGASENTDDKEDEKVVSFIVPKGGIPANQRLMGGRMVHLLGSPSTR
jgi:hypothetical protein